MHHSPSLLFVGLALAATVNDETLQKRLARTGARGAGAKLAAGVTGVVLLADGPFGP